MSLDRYSYKEFIGKTNYWGVTDVTFTDFNLIVGKNSSGKSRLLSTINSLAGILIGKRQLPFEDCEWSIELNLNSKKFDYYISFKDTKVFEEVLRVDGDIKLSRKSDGSGEIRYEKENDTLTFKLPQEAIAAVFRRDEVQHPYLTDLNKWASNVILYEFGSDFGRSKLMGVSEAEALLNKTTQLSFDDPNHVVRVYGAAFNEYGHKLDKAIIKDMKLLGYDISDVGVDNLQTLIKFPIVALTMYTVEKDLNFKNPQTQMSQGMWRALALVIHLNICSLSKFKELVLIDDIGEGLDYTRSLAIVDLLISKAKKRKLQIVTTSNDRFVMNQVPLEYWSIIKRKAGSVDIFNIRNSEKTFNQFKYLGLNNFDFFASDNFDKF